MRFLALTFIIFSLLVLFQIFTGFYLFIEKYGISFDSIYTSIKNKSHLGILEVAYAHFFTFSLFLFFISHLLYFFKLKNIYFFIIAFTFLSGLLDIISPFLIKINADFTYLKLLSFLGFEFGIAFLILILFSSSIKKLKIHRE